MGVMIGGRIHRISKHAGRERVRGVAWLPHGRRWSVGNGTTNEGRRTTRMQASKQPVLDNRWLWPHFDSRLVQHFRSFSN